MSAKRPTSPTSPGNAGETLPAVAAEALRRLAGTPLPAAEASSFGPGEVWLAGAGPGSLECLTLGVVAALAKADAVVYAGGGLESGALLLDSYGKLSETVFDLPLASGEGSSEDLVGWFGVMTR